MLYHKDLGFPKGVALPSLSGLRLRYSRHALRAAGDEHLSEADLPKTVPTHYTLVEVEVDAANVVKSVLRFSLDRYRDLVVVLQPDGFVRTVWTNDTTDTHSTLNLSRYARGN